MRGAWRLASYTRPGRTAATVFVLGLLLLGAAAAEAQTTPRILVSNSAQGPDDSADTSGNDHAQLFHTGANTGGYILTSVRVNSEDPEDDAFDVEVCEADTSANEFPTSTCTALTAPGDFTLALPKFTHAGIALSANTNYVVVIKERSSASVELNSTTSSGEDTSLGLSDWSIKNYFYWNNSGTWTNQGGQNEALRIIVNGYAVVPVVTVATCSVASMQNQVWTGNLTAGVSGSITGFAATAGTLDDTTFTLGTTNYTIDVIAVTTGIGLVFSLSSAGFGNTAAPLVLHVGTQTFPFSDASYIANTFTYYWTTNLPTWADGDAVCLALTEVEDPPAVTSVEFTSTPPPTPPTPSAAWSRRR